MTTYTLQLNFDIRQVTRALNYKILGPNDDKCEKLDTGPLAGTFNFQAGDELAIEVIGASPNDDSDAKPDMILDSMSVTDCTLISIPANMREALSLFDPQDATSYLAKWSEAENTTPSAGPAKDTKYLRCKSNKTLSIVSKEGQWKVSGYLSIVLMTADGKSFPQLYFFDPESSSGTGNEGTP